MDEPVRAADLLERLRAGDTQAAEWLFKNYAQRLTCVAEQHLSRKLISRLDGEDVVQSVFRTFFRRAAAGEFKIDSSAQLWNLLIKITVLKARAKARFHTAARRDIDAQIEEGDGWFTEALTREPGPAEAAQLCDEIEALLGGLPPLYCHILERALQGRPAEESAAELGISRRTVNRALRLLQDRLTAATEKQP